MKKFAVVWWIIRNFKGFVKVYTEGKDVYSACKIATSEESEDGKKVSKSEYVAIIDEVVELLEALKLGGK